MKGVKILTLNRIYEGVEATLGNLSAPGFLCLTLELPWRDNYQYVSCVPPGYYEVFHRSKAHPGRFKDCYELMGVPFRRYILIHKGNRPSEASGCILLGISLGKDGSESLEGSGIAMGALHDYVERKPFLLRIVDIVGGGERWPL